jgi:hypothetical protein
MDLKDKSPKVGLDNDGHMVIKNRAYRRKRKNLAELEGRKSKHFYTKRRANGRKAKRG